MENIKLQIAVCEDVPADAARVKQHIENSGIPSDIFLFANGAEFLRAFHAERYDIAFLDIYMRGESGVKTAERVRETDKNITLIFTTSSLDHTLESYRLNAIKYLEKPINAADIKDALAYALAKKKTRAVISLTVEGGKNENIPLDSIIFFEHKNHLVTITTTAGVLRTAQTARLDEIEKRLPSPPFLRCHRSFIVNLNYAEKIDRETHSFTMAGGGRADIPRRERISKYEEILQLWLIKKTGGNGLC